MEKVLQGGAENGAMADQAWPVTGDIHQSRGPATWHRTPIHEKSGYTGDPSRFRSADLIGRRVFEAMQTKTGVVTLAAEWYVKRKVALVLYDLIPWLRRLQQRSK